MQSQQGKLIRLEDLLSSPWHYIVLHRITLSSQLYLPGYSGLMRNYFPDLSCSFCLSSTEEESSSNIKKML